MVDDKLNGGATAEDFRQAAFQSAFEAPERVVLPASGLAVILRRPRLVFFTLTKTPHPGELTERIASAGSVAGAGLTPEELRTLSEWITEVFQAAFVEPKLALVPGQKEISPNWLLPGDVDFILSWVVSGPASSGIASFRGESTVADRSAGGGDVRGAAEPNTPRLVGRMAD